jgi:hypothetical protein
MEIQIIQSKIHSIRDQKVMLDYDLAAFFGTETKRLKEAVRRNIDRFPEDFMFELTKAEFDTLRSQNVTSKKGGTRYLPFAFTEHGVAMLSGILNSPKAVEMNIEIIRAFVALRHFTLAHQALALKIAELETFMGKELSDIHTVLHWLGEENQARADAIAALEAPENAETPKKERRMIGFGRE